MQLKEIEKLKKRELKQRVDDAFHKAEEKGPAYLMEAQFYMRELEHRHDSWVSLRDLLLEIIVIGLIGWEIWMGYTQEHQQAAEFDKQQAVMTNLERSTEATSSSLTALEAISDLRGAGTGPSSKSLPVVIDVTYSPMAKSLLLTNVGKSAITLLGYQFGWRRGPMVNRPDYLPPGESFEGISTNEAMKQVYFELANPYFVPFRLSFKGSDGTEYSSTTILAFTSIKGSYHVSCGATSIREYPGTRPKPRQ